MYRILVIEDDFSLAQIIKRQIESWGHDVRLITADDLSFLFHQRLQDAKFIAGQLHTPALKAQ